MPNIEDVIKDVAREGGAQENKKNEELIQLVVFELDKEEYGVDITDLQEIIKIPDITPVPNSPKFIRGIFNLRGKIIVTVDLEKRFNLERDISATDGNIIITEVEKNNFGVVVDRVSEIITVPKSSVQPTPSLISTKIQTDYLKGVVVIDKKNGKINEGKESNNDSRLIILLDLPKLLQEKELLNLGKTVQEIIK